MEIYQYEENADPLQFDDTWAGKTKQSDDGTHGIMHLMRGCGKGASSEVDSEKGSTITFFRRLGACWVMVLGRPLVIKYNFKLVVALFACA